MFKIFPVQQRRNDRLSYALNGSVITCSNGESFDTSGDWIEAVADDPESVFRRATNSNGEVTVHVLAPFWFPREFVPSRDREATELSEESPVEFPKILEDKRGADDA